MKILPLPVSMKERKEKERKEKRKNSFEKHRNEETGIRKNNSLDKHIPKFLKTTILSKQLHITSLSNIQLVVS